MTNFFLYLTLIAYFGATGLWLAYFLVQREGYYRAGAWVMAGGLASTPWPSSSGSGSPGYLPAATVRRGPAVVRLGPGGGLSAPDLALSHQGPGGPGGAPGGPDGVREPDPARRGTAPSRPCSRVSG